jgi:hypothetical protein
MHLKAFSQNAEKGKPSLKPRAELFDNNDHNKRVKFAEDLQIVAFGGICDSNTPSIVTPVTAERKVKAMESFESNLTGFVQAPQMIHQMARAKAKELALQAFSTKGDMPELISQSASILQGEINYDLNYELLFDPATKDPGREDFEVAIIRRGVQFRRMSEGERVRIEKMEGDKFQVSDAWFAAAIGWTEQSIRYRRLQEIADKSMAFRDAMQERRAGDFYSLVNQSVVANEVTDDTDSSYAETPHSTVGDTTADKDAKTLNNAYVTLMRRFYGAPGYGSATGQRRVYCLIQPENQERIMGALSRRFQAYSGSEGMVQYPITPIVSLNSTLWSGLNNTDFLLVIPGIKSKKHEEMMPTTFTDRDVYSLTYAQIVWMAYSGCMAASGQVQRGLLA